MASINASIATDWLEEDNLMLLECWTRDGYTMTDIANKIGITLGTLSDWKRKHPEIAQALKAGREIVDYKVENALLKSALGYKTKEVKVTTTMRYGKVVETVKEVINKDQAPNVHAAQCWLYNRRPDKWRNMNSRANILDEVEEDTSIQITVTRASQSQNAESSNGVQNPDSIEVDEEWQDEINQSIEIRKATKEEQAKKRKVAAEKKRAESSKPNTKVSKEPEDDLDYWPDDWEDEEED